METKKIFKQSRDVTEIENKAVERKLINYENGIQKRIRKAKELKQRKITEKDNTSESTVNSSQEVA